MSIITSPMLLGASTGGPYQITRSLRFNAPDSAYLSRTPSVAGNRRVFTWAGWIKRCKLGSRQSIFSAGTGNLSGDPGGGFYFDNITDTFSVVHGGGTTANITSAQVFRDVSAWFHLVAAYDTTQATSSNRIKIYVNGLQISFSGTYPSLNFQTDFNNTVIHAIGSRTDDGPLPASTADYYLAEIHFIDGQALDPSSFTTTDPTTGQLIPKAYTGTYGTNGFHLPFSDNSATTATTLGKDTSGNGNNFTPNNFSVTAGAGNDSLVDTPSSAGTDSGLGGQVTGNYCTWNPLKKGAAITNLTNGNLDWVSTTVGSNYLSMVLGTIGVSSGKWYWENTVGSSFYVGVGIATDQVNLNTYPGGDANSWSYLYNGVTYNNGSVASYGASFTTGDVVGVALNLDAGTLTFYKNGVSQGVAYSSLSGPVYFPMSGDPNSSTDGALVVNFGQRPFAYTAPSGFKALCDTNLPSPLIAKSSTVMDVKLYTGNGSTQTISGLGFSPDLVWIKRRDAVGNHAWFDQVRGATNFLVSSSTAQEGTDANSLTSFNVDGFSVSDPVTTSPTINGLSQAYVAWTWDAGTSTVTNTAGSITSSVRANASAGFSIVTFTGNQTSGATIGHGLNIAPQLIFLKSRSAVGAWYVYHESIGNTKYLVLQTTDATQTSTAAWNNTTPSSTVFTLGNNIQPSGVTQVAYCFAPVTGYSSFGSYTGNGSADGPFVFCGFRPRWILCKLSSASGADWLLFDTARSPYNVCNENLRPNTSSAEDASQARVDILSNGFKVKAVSGVEPNQSGGTYIYAAFAENPFQYARAR